MNTTEKNTVKVVAKLSPWLAPLPSAYFVARAAMAHLALPLPVAAVAAIIIETLGLSTVHTVLWMTDWNGRKRKTDPTAPVTPAIALGAVYVIATLGLVVFLEVWPFLATYAPALFPALAVVGAVNLALIAQQEQREASVAAQKAEARERRGEKQMHKKAAHRPHAGTVQVVQVSATEVAQNAVLDAVNRTRRQRKELLKGALMEAYHDDPGLGVTAAARMLGVHRNTIYGYLSELEESGQVDRSNGTVKVFVQGGNLALDIPGKVVLAMNDPDENGLWRCKLAPQLFLKFNKDGSGNVVQMELHQIIPLPRRSGPPEASDEVPERFRPYLGKYFLAALQAEFRVLYRNGSLAIYDPLEKKTVGLRPPDANGRWVDEFDKNTILFDRDGQGSVSAMKIDSTTKFRR